MVLEEKYPQVSRLEDLLPLSFQIVRFKVMAVRRKSIRRGEHSQVSVDDLPLPGPEPSPLRTAERRELVEKLAAAMRSAAPRCRELMRYKLLGKTFPEIRELMGAASINTIYTWDFRCRKELLERMGLDAGDLP